MITIRPVQKNDLHALVEVYINAYNSLDIGEHWNNETALQLMQYLYNDQPDLFFVAHEDEQIVGAIAASVKPWWDGNHIVDGELFIDPAHQKKGIGSQLVKHLFTHALEKYQAISWDTFTHRVHEHPLKWYKSIGFTEIEEWTMITGDIKEVLNKLK